MSAPRVDLHAAVDRLVGGKLLIFPTETVYGVGVSMRHPAAAEEIYRLKDRPRSMPLMMHVRGPEAIELLGRAVPREAFALAEAFWPGPLTLIVEAAPLVPRDFLGGGESVALRAPDHAGLRALLAELATREGQAAAIAGTSANPHAAPPPTDFASACAAFGARGPAVLDGGSCGVGVASTVLRVDPEHFEILRMGVVDAEAIAEVVGRRPQLV